jgi:site-specific DNA-cytosine methylase
MLPKVTETIREQKPRMVVLENVIGLKRVIDDVMEELDSIPGYFTMHIDIDPYTLGCPTARPRIYILMISRASLIDGSDEALQVQAENVLKAGTSGVGSNWCDPAQISFVVPCLHVFFSLGVPKLVKALKPRSRPCGEKPVSPCKCIRSGCILNFEFGNIPNPPN